MKESVENGKDSDSVELLTPLMTRLRFSLCRNASTTTLATTSTPTLTTL